jgi:hypothetical protein
VVTSISPPSSGDEAEVVYYGLLSKPYTRGARVKGRAMVDITCHAGSAGGGRKSSPQEASHLAVGMTG